MAVVAAAAAAGIPLEVFIAEEVLTNLFFQLVGQVVANALAPEFDALRYASYSLTPGTRLSPGEAAVAVVKGHLDPRAGEDEARVAGIEPGRFQTMVAGAGNPPPADLLLQLARRGIIPIADAKGSESISATQGMRESFLHNKWVDPLLEGQWNLPSVGALLEARLRNFITPGQFNTYMHYLGFKTEIGGGGPGGGSESINQPLADLPPPGDLELLAAGVPLSPGEGYDAYHRGLIPLDNPNPNVPSLKQIFRESRYIDKYIDVWVGLQEYLPPPRTVTALLRVGSISRETALALFKKAGLSQELAAAYVADASNQRLQGTKELAKGDILNLYKAKEMSAKDAHDALATLGYSDTDIGFELGYADFQVVEAQVSAGVSRLRTLYVGHKISKQTALDALAGLGLTTQAVDATLKVWDVQAQANPSLLTAVQLADAAAQGYMPVPDAFTELQGRGYDARDAFIMLALHKADVSKLELPAGATLPS